MDDFKDIDETEWKFEVIFDLFSLLLILSLLAGTD